VEEAFSKIFEFLAVMDSKGDYSRERIETMRQKLGNLKVPDPKSQTSLGLGLYIGDENDETDGEMRIARRGQCVMY
jgi:hypothetical protein